MANAVIPFTFNSREVRTLLIDNQPWFFAVDVCCSLNLKDTNKALIGLDDDERCEHEQYSGSGRKPVLINESGLYSLIFRSRKAEAKRFKKWVTADVLPQIRKTGHYQISQPQLPIGKKGHECLSGLIDGKTSHLQGKQRTSAKSRLWAQLRKAFDVSAGADIPADEFNNARQFIGGYVLEGDYLPAGEVEQAALPLDREVPEYHYQEFGKTFRDGQLIVKELRRFVPGEAKMLLKQLDNVLISGWTVMDESLMRIAHTKHMLEKWRGAPMGRRE